MNYILGLLFTLFIFTYYYMVGRKVLAFVKYEYDFDRALLAGFISTFFLGFVVGEPLQLLSSSWNSFFIGMSIILIVVGIFSFKKEYFRVSKESIKEIILDHWLIILLAGLFLFLSMTNLLPYYHMNYDDSFYIGKVVNQIGTPHLLNENYFSGAVVQGASGDLTRTFNTFELVYGYFATLFHIGVPFFCRAVMSFHNYLMMFITYKCFGSLFVSKKSSQYVIAIFSIFLIIGGFYQESLSAPFVLRIFDAWQLNTAMWYGGSIVRMTSIPVVILFGKDLWEKLDFKKFIFVVIVYITFISFSTIFFHNGIVLFMIFAIIKCFDYLFDESIYLKLLGVIGTIGLIYTFVYINQLIPSISKVDATKLADNITEFARYYRHFYLQDQICIYGPFILLVGMILGNSRYEKYMIATVLGIYLLEYKMYFMNILMLSTGYYFFVALRLMSSMQYMIVLVSGIILVAIFERMSKHHFIVAGLSSMILVSSLALFYTKYDVITSQTFEGSGMMEGGYSIENLTTNDEMVPPLFVKLKEYFNALPYGNYSLMGPDALKYQDTYVPYVGFVIASNRIEIFDRETGCGDLTADEFSQIQDYFHSKASFNSIASIIERTKIQYLLVQKEEQKADMENNGYTLVLQSDEETPYYLYATNL